MPVMTDAPLVMSSDQQSYNRKLWIAGPCEGGAYLAP